MRSKNRRPFRIVVQGPASGLNTRLPHIGTDASNNLRDAVAATNMRFEDGAARNSPGYELVTMSPDPDGPINLIGQTNLSSELVSIATRSPIIGTTKSLYAQNSDGGYLTVFAGPNQVLYDTTSATLAATFIDTFGDGTNTPTFLWTQLSGPSGSDIISPTAQTTDVESLAPGTYVFQVVASDSGIKSTATVTVKIFYSQGTTYPINNVNASAATSGPSNGYIYFSSPQDGLTSALIPSGIQIYNPVVDQVINVIAGSLFDGINIGAMGTIIYNPIDKYLYLMVVGTAGDVGQKSWIVQIDPADNSIRSQTQFVAGINGNFAAAITPLDLLNLNIMVVTVTRADAVTGFVVVHLANMTMDAFVPGVGGAQIFYNGICYNYSDGLMYSAGRNTSTNDIILSSIDPATGTIVNVNLGPITGGTGGPTSIAYCPVDNCLYFGVINSSPSSGNGLYKYNLVTPALTQVDATTNARQVLWEPNNGKIYFINQIAGDTDPMQVCFYDPTAKTLTKTDISVSVYARSSPIEYPNNFGYSLIFNSFYSPFGEAYNAP